ncbi:hypothetical protein [Streptomyces sp. CC224B]|uniref:hypothetical protein n=1 Tax=Streptomyces sp. CC224B TaxID=3044571 RepID=UPI0024A9ABC1|nr:hypothetical protein [Streptomyces sp. CC224B]
MTECTFEGSHRLFATSTVRELADGIGRFPAPARAALAVTPVLALPASPSPAALRR